jgi:hypothetical protein
MATTTFCNSPWNQSPSRLGGSAIPHDVGRGQRHRRADLDCGQAIVEKGGVGENGIDRLVAMHVDAETPRSCGEFLG